MREQERLGHAWLLSGRAGIGKSTFAHHFAQLALCEEPLAIRAACGHCRSCSLFLAGNHPDLRIVRPIEEANSISIDQIRALSGFFALKSHYGKAKIALLEPVDVLTRGAANAVLKQLEEPPELGLFLLVANHLERLPATVRSRCQRLALDNIDPEVALHWLETQTRDVTQVELRAMLRLHRQAPLAALEAMKEGKGDVLDLLESQMVNVAAGRVHAVQAAEACRDIVPLELADMMLNYVHRVALARYGLEPGNHDATGDPIDARVENLARQLQTGALCQFIEAAIEVKNQAGPTANFRQADLIDILWSSWMRASRPATRRQQVSKR